MSITKHDNGKITNIKSTLTPAKKNFAIEYAKTDNGTQSVLKAFDNISSPEVASVKASRLLGNDIVSQEIKYQKNRLEKLASKAVRRVESLIDSENESIATTNAWKTIEQVQGRATQKIEQQNTSLNINIDLSGVFNDDSDT